MDLVINRETAEKEIDSWLDYKKVLSYRAEDNVLVQKIQFINSEAEAPVKKLEYKPRLKVFEIHEQTQNEKSTDSNSIILAYVAALTGVAKGTIKKFDTEDYNICQAIAIFFL